MVDILTARDFQDSPWSTANFEPVTPPPRYIVLDREIGEALHNGESFTRDQLEKAIADWLDDSHYTPLDTLTIAEIVEIKNLSRRVHLTLDTD